MRLGDAVRGATGDGWVGLNCSIPHKVEVVAIRPLAVRRTDRSGELRRLVMASWSAAKRWAGLSRHFGRDRPARSRGSSCSERRRGLAHSGRGGRSSGAGVDTSGKPQPRSGAQLVKCSGTHRASARVVPWDRPFRLPEATAIVVNEPLSGGSRRRTGGASRARQPCCADGRRGQ